VNASERQSLKKNKQATDSRKNNSRFLVDETPAPHRRAHRE
jgi:hypothetical protein